jgi:superfamily II DNA or RNA helicase
MPVILYTTPLSVRVRIDKYGNLIDYPSFSIYKYLEKFCEFHFDPRIRQYIRDKRYTYYNKETSTVSIPLYDIDNLVQLLNKFRIAYTIQPIPLCVGKPIDIEIDSAYPDREELQTQAVDYIIHSKENVVALALQTGKGKSSCAIKSIAGIGKRAMICVNGLLEQWKEAIKKFTHCTDEDIYFIIGIDSVDKLLAQIDKTIFPKFILCSTSTIQAYATDKLSYRDFPPFEEFCDRLNIGVRVTDEAHLNFHANMMLDLRMNTHKTILLSATFDRSNKFVKKIFHQHYPREIRFGEDEYKQYVNIHAYRYSFGMGIVPSRAYKTINGYSHAKYEAWLLDPRNLNRLEYVYRSVFSPLIYSHYINIMRPGQRLLIICTTHEMCRWFETTLSRDTPHLVSKIYISETEDVILSEADIIISTPRSAGVGRDIANLRSVLITSAIGSESLNEQMLGRLRELPNGDIPEFCYVCNTEIPPQNKYHEIRRNIFTQLGRSFQEATIG